MKNMETKVLGKMNQNLLFTVSMLFLFIGEHSINVIAQVGFMNQRFQMN